MKKDYLTKAVELIGTTDAVFAAVSENDIITSPVKGISFVASLCNENRDLSCYCAADKIVGRAAAMLFVLLKLKCVHAKILSEGGAKVLEEHGIKYTYDTLTQMIINRKGDGMCPMEEAVKDCTDPKEALKNINSTIQRLRSHTEK